MVKTNQKPPPKHPARFVEPMQCLALAKLPEGPDWEYEIKFDGYRALGIRSAGRVRLMSRNGNDFSARFPSIANALSKLPDDTIVDGEIVALDETGRPSFNVLQNYNHSATPLEFYAFDLLHLAGKNLRDRPLHERRELLRAKLMPRMQGEVRFSETFKASAAEVVAAVKKQGLEGVIAKRRDSLYEPGRRSGAWVKMRINKGQELVIGGYVPSGKNFDSLIVGYYEGDDLIYIARVSSGFVPALRAKVFELFRKHESKTCPFSNLPQRDKGRWGQGLTADKMAECRWLKPHLVAQIEYADWTDVNHLRHSKFIALRDDKPAKDVRRERTVGRLIPPTEARRPSFAKQPGDGKGANVRLSRQSRINSMGTNPSGLDTFDHVVVLMFENRSFDNILGYLYQDGVPIGKNFEGVAGKALTNPDAGGQPIPVSIGADFHQPYPDPGEEFAHVTFQLFGPSQPLGTPQMKGFVQDYYGTLQGLQKWRGSPAAQSPAIMKCFAPNSLPVLSELAKEFAVFDRWFCAVPSQTWCNRAFWHAATSWGWVNNPPASDPSNPWNLEHWALSSVGSSLFDLIEDKFGPGSWHVYEDLAVPFTKLVHWGDLKDKIGEEYFRYLESGHPFHNNFFDDCAMGGLPKYSFLEPHFINFFEDVFWHDDLHPSSFDSPAYSNGGPGSVLLGDRLVWKVYQAIRNSKSSIGNNWQNTLLIVTFDEHGGCFDHVAPPQHVAPPDAKGFNTGQGEEGFDFTRLGVRVPMVMVSAYIAKNTIVNSLMHHCSFLKTMEQKWGLSSLGPRQDTALPFTEVFVTSSRTLDSWPDFEFYPGPSPALDATMMRAVDPSTIQLNPLQASILDAILELCVKDPAAVNMRLTSAKDALALLNRVKNLRYPAR